MALLLFQVGRLQWSAEVCLTRKAPEVSRETEDEPEVHELEAETYRAAGFQRNPEPDEEDAD